MNRPRCLWLWCALLLGLATRAEAGWHSSIRTMDDSGVYIGFSSPFDHPPAEGFMPCWVTIRNRSGAAHTWTVHASGHGFMGGGDNQNSSSQSLRVENEATARMPVLLPLEPLDNGAAYYRSNTFQIDGYAVEQNATGIPPLGYSGKKPTPFIGMGATLAVPLWEPLKKDYEDKGIALTGSPVEVRLLGADWRGLSGLDCLWLTDTEYTGLDPDQRAAIRHWIDLGGIFYLCTQTLDPALRDGLGLPATGGEAHPGFGTVKLIPWDGKVMAQPDAAAIIDGIKPLRSGESAKDATGWRIVRSLGIIPLNAPFLIGFIAVFATLVGPVNLFWLADATRRHRLFWTTPLISLSASLLLLVVIVLQDGFGGHGERVMVTMLFPDRKEAVVVQEQATRTGVLLARQFAVTEDILLAPLKVRRGSRGSFDQAGRSYGGDWFASRSVQAQRMEAIVPSRAEIQLLNAEAESAGAPPVVVSSIPAALKEIRYVAPSGRGWRGGALRAGERITLQPDPALGFDDALGGSGFLARLQTQVRDRPGWFYAVADDGPFIDTLPAIHWRKQQAVFLGPVTRAP